MPNLVIEERLISPQSGCHDWDLAWCGSALAGLETRVLLIDDINPAFAADDAAVFVTLLERPEGIANLHDTAF
jgi:hypothetical protein